MAKLQLNLFKDFFQSEKAGGFILIACTAVSLIIANTQWGGNYLQYWHSYIDLSFPGVDLNYSIEHWVNDGLMAIFFLLVGLEIERELYVGELSSFKNAVLPVLAAAGGMLVPALIHLFFNAGTETQAGFGIPMATDIAFALGILSLVSNKVPVALKVFLAALAIIDDLGAITVIAIFYAKDFSAYYFFAAMAVFAALFIAGKRKIYSLPLYLAGGVIMWYCMLKSGVHASIAGVLLAFAIPFHKDDDKNISYKLQHFLHKPVAFIILPIFALANTAIIFPANLLDTFTTRNSIGIIAGLIAGKFAGIFLTCFLAVKLKIAALSNGLHWKHIFGVSLLGGIGFTMSIFIANLAFTDPQLVTAFKMSILAGSVCAALAGLLVLKIATKPVPDQGTVIDN
ncbi:MAG: Na+/H+ antiporter NhaA [Chitinophagaceae bacterium]